MIFSQKSGHQNKRDGVLSHDHQQKSDPSIARVGGAIEQTNQFLNRRVESDFEITEFEINQKVKFKTTSGPIPIEGGFTCEPVTAGETKITLFGEADIGGFFKLAEPIVTRMFQRQLNTNLSNLKDLLEA